MNNFEQTFFKKFVPEWQEIIEVFHRHWIKIFDDIFLALGLWVLIPIFLYSTSLFIQENISFIYFEIYLIILYLIIIYKIFDWYNDVLILTNSWITRLEWSLFKSDTSSVDYEHIEWSWVEQNWVLDKILNRWDVIIHKFWEEEIVLDEASKPYNIVNKIEEITSQIEHPEELTKFDLMMDVLGWIVENYLWQKENKNPYSISPKEREVEQKLSKELQEDFLKNIENKNGTIDLR